MTRNITSLLAALVLGVVLSPAALADPPADKGKGQGQPSEQAAGKGGKSPSSYSYDDESKGKGKDKSGDKDSGDRYDPYEDKYQGAKADANHGQRVSDCNHRANGKQLKGQERKEYVEWCVDHGERYQYDDKRWTGSRNCYQKADDRKLSGDERRRYISSCLSSTIFR
jgi:hypothetical protein